MAKVEVTRPITELAEAVRAGTITAVKLVQAALDRIAATEPEFHALIEVRDDQALASARAIDEQLAGFRDRGELDKAASQFPLAGVPFVAKDNYLDNGLGDPGNAHKGGGHTTAASNILRPFKAPYEAVALTRLQAAGAVMVGKANMDAFAHGTSTENSDFGPTGNAHDSGRVPGGSSGGSATSVALGQVTFAVGSDTGGSIRQPAGLSGVVGFKPTYGLIPRTGVVAMGSSFDVLGPITRSVADTGLVLDVLAGRDASDATSIARDDSYVVKPGSLKGLKIGTIKEYLGDGLEAGTRQRLYEAVDQLKAHGAEIHEMSLPSLTLALAAYYVLVPAEISSNLARYDGVRFGHSSDKATNLAETYLFSREEGFGAEAKRRIMIGTYVLSSGYYDAYYKRAQKVRTKLIAEFNHAFDKCDLLIGPTSPNSAFPIGSKISDPLTLYLEDVMTVAVNLVGIPAITLPMGKSQGMPVGLQLMAPQRAERKLLETAQVAEDVIGDWRARV